MGGSGSSTVSTRQVRAIRGGRLKVSAGARWWIDGCDLLFGAMALTLAGARASLPAGGLLALAALLFLAHALAQGLLLAGIGGGFINARGGCLVALRQGLGLAHDPA